MIKRKELIEKVVDLHRDMKELQKRVRMLECAEHEWVLDKEWPEGRVVTTCACGATKRFSEEEWRECQIEQTERKLKVLKEQ